LQEAYDFLEESNKLFNILSSLENTEFETPTLFRGWTINDILRHLHTWNHAVMLSILDEENFQIFIKEGLPAVLNDEIRMFERKQFPDLEGRDLLQFWKENYEKTSEVFSKQDPKARLKWAGPDMSARSSITARLMETWAHSQAVYDLLGVDRQEQDYIKNIVVLGINTFSWSYKVNGLSVPEKVPFLKLTSPSGEIWQWNDPGNENRIEGLASEFCQTVCQTRNVEDTNLKVTGEIAEQWMSIAQCFAGPAKTPPIKGERIS
jgi:uncharacterized protein (TIGR03084 family)